MVLDAVKLATTVTEVLCPHAVGRVGEDHIELASIRRVCHVGEAVDVEEGVLVGVEGCADDFGQLDVAVTFLLALEDFESFVSGLGLGNCGVGEVLGDNDFLPDSVLIGTVTTASEFFGSVGNCVGWRGWGFDGWQGVDCLSALGFLLHRAESVEPCNGCRVFLPGQVSPLEVFIEFGFFGFEQGEFPNVGERYDTVGEDLAIVLERAAEFEDFADGFQPPLAGYQHPGIALPT